MSKKDEAEAETPTTPRHHQRESGPPRDGLGLLDSRQIVNSVLTASLLAALFGGWKFYDTTRMDILLLRTDIARVEAKVDRALATMERAPLGSANPSVPIP